MIEEKYRLNNHKSHYTRNKLHNFYNDNHNMRIAMNEQKGSADFL